MERIDWKEKSNSEIEVRLKEFEFEFDKIKFDIDKSYRKLDELKSEYIKGKTVLDKRITPNNFK